jgi:hypothetical protein
MKKILTLLTIILSGVCQLPAQAQLPEFGTPPSVAEMQMKEYDKDKSAPALILAEKGKVAFDHDNSGETVMERKVSKRIKIFTD